jgi:hypothetical protein
VAIGREPREPREREPAAKPAPERAPTLTYDPGRSSGGVGPVEGGAGVIGTIGNPAGFFGAAVGTVINAFTKKDRPYRGRRLVLDSETGKIAASGSIPQGRGVQTFVDAEKASLTALERTYATGIVQPGIAPWYLDFANAIVSFRDEVQSSSPGDHVPSPTVPGDRGETVPGFESPLPTPEFPRSDDERGGELGSDVNRPIDLRNLFMPLNPYMPFSGLPMPRGGGGSVRRRKKKRAATRTRSSRRSRGSKPARLVKGSAAAKRHMARLRRMRK